MVKESASEDRKITIESLLRMKLTELLATMSTRDENLFDENTDIIKMFLSRDVKAYQTCTAYQTKLENALKEKMLQVQKDSIRCNNAISKKKYIETKRHEYEWTFRKDYLFKIIDIYIARGILESENPPIVNIKKAGS